MYNLGQYYDKNFKYKDAKRYYLMTIKHKNHKAMYKLAYIYQKIDRNYSKAEYYYLMSIELCNYEAANVLAQMYENIGNKEAKRYYLTAFINGRCQHSLCLLNILDTSYLQIKHET